MNSFCSFDIQMITIMPVAPCSVSKTKIELQVGKICEEEKCVNSVQQNLTEIKTT
jgi:hypothetical protein